MNISDLPSEDARQGVGGDVMTARTFSQADLAKIFAEAEASAEDLRPANWDTYVLAFVAASVGVRVAAHDARAARVLGEIA